MMFGSNKGAVPLSVGTVAIAALAALLIGAFSAKSIDLAVSRSMGILISICYGALPWMVIWQLYRMGPEARYVILVMAVTWCGDTGGYFGGKYLGGKIFGARKMAPVISPKKTWEGAVTGLLLSVVGALVANECIAGGLGPTWVIVVVALFGGAFAQLGDLVESTFKRFAGVKDSGVLIPGHGGFLDRFDGILFAAPVIWAILYYFQ
jgi:phosphatidate cytidylyltransferase